MADLERARRGATRARQVSKPAITWALRRTPGRRAKWGSLRRLKPFDPYYGYRRGHPVDRYYIEGFLHERRSLVRGRVMEVGSSMYTSMFGGQAVTASEVVDIDDSNALATLLADLTVPRSLPVESYDCVILTHALQYMADQSAALRTVWESLRFGGTLLLTVPCLSRMGPDRPTADLWRWTPPGLERQLSRDCDGADLDVVGYGNVLTCMSFLYGLAQEELTPRELGFGDPAFPLIACASATKNRART
jgi:hypothetical protein